MSLISKLLIEPVVDWILQDKVAHNKSNTILTIELVPFTMHGKNLRAVLSKEHWREVCAFTHNLHRHRCLECGRDRLKAKLECHEQWEYSYRGYTDSQNKYKTIGVMRMERLLTLCHECHMGKHIKLAEKKGEYEHTKEHLKKVYGLTDLQFKWKVHKAVKKVREQSKFNYELDLTFMNHQRYGFIQRAIGRQFTSNDNRYCFSKTDHE